jgi:RNA polymerase sigma-70 factor (ECF subfamily)
MLGNGPDADDAVQETWLRLSAVDPAGIENLTGWLTTVISRICLNLLRSRRRHPTDPLDDRAVVTPSSGPTVASPDERVVLDESVGEALLVVLDRLGPGERITFVLHDTFAVPFEEIAGILDKSPEACRQLASRARRRVRVDGAPGSDPVRQREVVGVFLAAARTGDLRALLALLDPAAELVADAAAVTMGAPAVLTGSDAVAAMFSGRAKGARPALIDGLAGLLWSRGGTPAVAFDFTVEAGRVTRIEMIADHDVLDDIDIDDLRGERAP